MAGLSQLQLAAANGLTHEGVSRLELSKISSIEPVYVFDVTQTLERTARAAA